VLEPTHVAHTLTPFFPNQSFIVSCPMACRERKRNSQSHDLTGLLKLFSAKFTDLTQSIYISAETLFTFLERAEPTARRLKQGEGLIRSTKPRVRNRRRDSTPPEHLDLDREGIFAVAS
jgi:hypothetical protein